MKKLFISFIIILLSSTFLGNHCAAYESKDNAGNLTGSVDFIESFTRGRIEDDSYSIAKLMQKKQDTLQSRPSCITGKIMSANTPCIGGKNYFTFIADNTTPINFYDVNLQFVWSVTDSNNNPVGFVPTYIAGSTVATYIEIPFQATGSYTITLNINSSNCNATIQEKVDLGDCRCSDNGGEIKLKQDKACVGKEITMGFTKPEDGFTYEWSIVNSNFQTIFTGNNAPGFSTIMNQTGTYSVFLTITDRNGCVYFYIYTLKVDNCNNQCVLGFIDSTNLCADADNYFYFNLDPSTPLDFSDPDLVFEWNVTDSNGNPVSFQPVYLFGSTIPYYIIVQSGGTYTVSLTIKNKKCEEKFEITVRVEGCGCKRPDGTIKIKGEKACAGDPFTLYFSNPVPGLTSQWTILNSNYQPVYTSAGAPLIIPTITLPGEYTAILIITDERGCEFLYLFTFKVDNCDNSCLFGSITNANLCVGNDNYFYFIPDPSTPINFLDPDLDFAWTVTDSNGNPVTFQPIYLFGSSFAYYINVPFTTIGQHTITLTIKTKECTQLFEKIVYVSKCGCEIRGSVKIKDDKICVGKEVGFEFTDHEASHTYTWNILNSSYQNVYTLTGNTPTLGTIINTVGDYTLILTVTGANGCQNIFIITFKVEACLPVVNGDCFYHLGFSFATPNGAPLDNAKRLSMVQGIVDFVNQNVDGKLFVTSVDDHRNGTRFYARQSNVDVIWNQAYVNPSNEIEARNSVGNLPRIRVQDNDYGNTIINVLNKVTNSNQITMPINVNFVIASKDSNSNDLIESYNDFLASGKVEKIFFILLEGGEYILNDVTLSAQSFVSQVIGVPAVNFSLTGNVLSSNYVIVPATQIGSLNTYFKSFLQNAYNSVKAGVECPDCVEGAINSAQTLCASTDNAFWFVPTGTIDGTDPQLNFSWTVTSNGNPVAFDVPGGTATAISIPNAVAGNYVVTLVVTTSTCTKTFVKNVSIGVCGAGSCGDATNQYYIVGLFKNLLIHLKNQPAGSITNGYSCPDLIALLPYINQTITTPKIYNFTNANNTISFSFSASAVTPHVVLKIPAVSPNYLQSISLGGAYISMTNQTNFAANYFAFSGILPQYISPTGSNVSQINFCPTELECINHIAIVLDESTSITPVDAGRIRRQLRNFIEQQVVFHETIGSQLRVSLIGLSDDDEDYREDHKINIPVNAANKPQLLAWINGYKNRYTQGLLGQGLPGISSNSDYWNSGLSRALLTDAKLVILITDGAQTGDLSLLDATMDQFDNGGNSASSKHLYVIGLTNGFYIDGDASSGRYSETFNPNFTPVEISEDDEVQLPETNDLMPERRLTDFLRISLRYFIYDNTQFPNENIYDFTSDYSGHQNFKFLYDDPYYLSNNLLKYLDNTCGVYQELDRCDECYGVQLDPGNSYVVSAWVHVDKTQQVTSFNESLTQTPSVEIQFCSEGNIDYEEANPTLPLESLPDFTDSTTGQVYPGKAIFYPQGNIIDGWQRIFGVFKVHPNTKYLRILLNNESASDAMHFDDLRIHPLEGSMKSFVYDENNYRLMSELDENNYSTYYEYDGEGGLVRVKKETERGVKTIQESRSGTKIKQ